MFYHCKKASKHPSPLVYPSEHPDSISPCENTSATISLKLCWAHFMGKCIDASPLLLAFNQAKKMPEQGSHARKEMEPEREKEKGTSPVGVLQGKQLKLVIYIGSHSKQFCALDARSGQVLWKQELGGRIESSATASKTGEGTKQPCLWYTNSRHIARGDCRVLRPLSLCIECENRATRLGIQNRGRSQE